MTPRCATCKHWTAFTQEGEVVEAVYGTCRESPAKLGKPADEWCGRYRPNDAAVAEAAWRWRRSVQPGLNAIDFTHEPGVISYAEAVTPGPWWARIFR